MTWHGVAGSHVALFLAGDGEAWPVSGLQADLLDIDQVLCRLLRVESAGR